ncbi:putative peptidyl-tRNA hydrolase PTRHD1-like protein [Blastocladiella britannica]|nr:putative peptidyl-tRNA hydrolase PTRHD1-like protein [Blastocladiella britannica]
MKMEPLTMFVVVRRDLVKTLAWPLGSVISQGCHAATAALWTFREHPETIEYVTDLGNMHKVVYEIKNESQLSALAQSLKEREIDFALWREQPENMLTALSTRPYRRSELGDAFKKCGLFR